jgi:serine/threonine-protein kinase
MTEAALASSRQRIGSYETLLELGRGGMGTAYLARAVGAGGFKRLVVIKRLNRDMLDNREALQRFLAEARVSAVVHHANVVGTQQVGEDEQGPFLVLDYIEGVTLEELVDRAALRGDPIPAPIVLRIGLDALSGLDAVHNARDASGRVLNILHRDVSLQNVLVGRDGVSRVADFGIAKSELSSFSTDQSYLVGKLLYLPREYLRRQPVGPTLDVYSLGVTLWLAVTGVELWEGASEAQLVRHIIEETVPPPSQFVKIAPQIESVILRACAPEALDRYQSAREMVDAIDLVGRLTGWVASHADVVRYVEYLAGRDLDARRERIALMTGETVQQIAAYELRPTAAAKAPTHDPVAITRIEPKERSKMSLFALAALLVAGAGVAGSLLWLHRQPPPNVSHVDAVQLPPQAAVAEIAVPPATELAVAPAEAARIAPPVASTSAPSPAAAPVRALSRSGSSRRNAEPAPSPAAQPAPPPSAAAASPIVTPAPAPTSAPAPLPARPVVQAPDDIVKNPYE